MSSPVIQDNPDAESGPALLGAAGGGCVEPPPLVSTSQLFAGILDLMPVILYRLDRDGITTESVGKGLERLGLKPGEAVGRSAIERYPQCAREIRSALAGGNVYFETQGELEGEPWWFTDYLAHDAQRGGAIGFAIDVTESRLAERARHQAEARLRSIVRHAPSRVMLLDAEGRIEYTNHEIDGDRVEDAIGRNFLDYVPVEYVEAARRCIEGVAATGEPSCFETASCNRDDSGDLYSVAVGPILAGDVVTGMVLSASDITEQRRLEKEVLEVGDRQRARFGKELHDGLCQLLTGLGLIAQVHEQKLADRQAPEAGDAKQIVELVNDGLYQARALGQGLDPVQLEAKGLMAALEKLAHRVERHQGIDCRFRCERPILVRDNSTATHLYHIARDAVDFAIDPGGAREVTLDLASEGDRASLTIAFRAADDAPARALAGSLGARMMAYRARMIGAVLSFELGLDSGQAVKCLFDNPKSDGV